MEEKLVAGLLDGGDCLVEVWVTDRYRRLGEKIKEERCGVLA